MPSRAPSDPDTAMALGEIRGQLREIIHTMRNEEMKNDALARTIAKLENVPDDIVEIKKRLTALATAGACAWELKREQLRKGWTMAARP